MCANLLLRSQLIYFRRQTTPVKYCFFTVTNQQLAQYNSSVLIFLINGKAALPTQPPVANLINWKHVTSLSLIVHTFSSEEFINASYIILLPISPCPCTIHQEPNLLFISLSLQFQELSWLWHVRANTSDRLACPRNTTMTHYCTLNLQCLMPSTKYFLPVYLHN